MERTWDTELEEHEPLQHLTVSMFGKTYKLQPASDLELHPSSIGEHLQEQPSRYAFYASVHAMSVAKVTALQQQLDSARSVVDEQIRSAGLLPSGGKITEDGLRRAVRGDKSCCDVEEKLHDAEFDALVLEKIVRAFEHRREMIVEMARRSNSGIHHDSDINITVSANIDPIDERARHVGQHPSKKAR